jgi:hypothetical protein
VWGSPRKFETSNNAMLGAIGGDYALAAAIARQSQAGANEGDFTLGSDRTFRRFGGANWRPSAAPRALMGMDGVGGFTYQPDAMHYKELQVKLAGSAEVKGEATLTVKIEPSGDLLRAVEMAKQVVKLGGSLQAKGPGSNGRTSPDASPGAGGRLGHI